MTWSTSTQIELLLVACFGVSLLTAVGIAYRARRRAGDSLSCCLRLLGWSAVLTGTLTPFLVAIIDGIKTAPEATLGMVLGSSISLLIFIVATRAQYWRAKLGALQLCIAAAIEQRMPVADAVRALAWEQSNRFGRRCRKFASDLEQGASLADAYPMQDAEAFIAFRIGALHDRVSQAIRESLQFRQRHTNLLRYCYGAMMMAAAMFLVWFLDFKISQIFGSMMTQQRAGASNLAMLLTAMRIPFIVIHMLVFLAAAGLAIYQLAFEGQNTPLLNRFAVLADQSRVLRALAGSAEVGQPVLDTMTVLAAEYPKPHMRVQLSLATAQQQAGRHWIETLATARIVTPGEAAVLSAAERAGNLPWGLKEMARRKSRRIESIWKTIDLLVIPTSTLLFAILVGSLGVAMFRDLAALIRVS